MQYGEQFQNKEIREQLLVWEYFRFATEGVFCEVGAHDPKNLSQTWLLEKVGWSGVLLEPLPDKCEALRRVRPRSRVFELAAGAPDQVGEADFHVSGGFSSLEKHLIDNRTAYDSTIRVRVSTLDVVLREAAIDRLDFLSIDTEGTGREVLKGLDLARIRPALLLVEDHLLALAVHHHMEENGFRFIRRTGYNNWYVPESSPDESPILERLKLFRKIRLGTPLRAFRFERVRRKRFPK